MFKHYKMTEIRAQRFLGLMLAGAIALLAGTARAFLLVMLVMPALAAGGETLLVSRAGGPAGAGGDDSSGVASISADGRFVAFASNADNLSTGDNNSFDNVFVRDTLGGPPRCSDIVQAVAHNEATSVGLACADADDDPIARSIVSGPAHGVLGAIDPASGTVTYTPNPGYTGPDAFSFRAVDATGASAAATASLAVAPPPPLFSNCYGRVPTLVGDDGNNVLKGSPGADVILGGGGADRIDGRGGNDRICGGDGNDTLRGGTGNDRVSGDAGADRVEGGSGSDRLDGGAGTDFIAGGKGRDRCRSGEATFRCER